MLTQAELKSRVKYDPETGDFTWVSNPFNSIRVRIGFSAGYKRLAGDTYVLISINSVQYFVHRLAWLYIFGSFPNGTIDHINGNKSDNRLLNLREATLSQNGHNKTKFKNNKSGYKGVCWDDQYKKWEVRVMVNRKSHFIGRFSDLAEAASKASNARKILHGEFSRD